MTKKAVKKTIEECYIDLESKMKYVKQPKKAEERVLEALKGSLLLGGGLAAAIYLTDEEAIKNPDTKLAASAKAGLGLVCLMVGSLKGVEPLVEGLFIEDKWVDKNGKRRSSF